METLLLTANGGRVKLFKLSERFVEKYKKVKPPFGFNGLGELVYMRTYSRIKEDGTNEKWWETIKRVIEGTYNIQKRWIENLGLGWNAHQAQYSAQEMYDRMFNMKFLPPGRGLWAMGSPIIEERGLFAALNNCSFTSTEFMKDDPAKPFCFLMDMSMLGVGVGFDVKGAGTVTIKGPDKERSHYLYVIPDTREGWVESIRLLLESYFYGTAKVSMDYRKVRHAGSLIKTFGGVSAGPVPLKELHHNIEFVLNKEEETPISVTDIVDIMNYIGKAVIAGNVRRTAEIVFGDYKDDEYLRLKDYEWNGKKYIGPSADRADRGWASNNSIFADVGMDYTDICERIKVNGEPGIAWLENMRAYSRMIDGPDWIDVLVAGANPCTEQSMEDKELCNLVEKFIFRHTDINDFKRTIKFAYLYAKTVSLGSTHWPDTNRILLRNRRIGCSMSGIAQFVSMRGLNELKEWCIEGYKTIEYWDNIYSKWFCVPKSIKKTSVKPSGTVSLLAGATPGIHYPEFNYYIRRVNLAKNSSLIEPIVKAGYKVEGSVTDKNSVIVEFPVNAGNMRTIDEVPMWEQMSMAAFMQKYWADNQVSATVSFDPETEGSHIAHALNHFQYQLKAISFLPKRKTPAYAQMPYEKITEDQYKILVKKVKPIKFSNIKENQALLDRFCDGDSCELEAENIEN